MAAAMAMLVDAVKTKETVSETVSAPQLSAVSKMNSFGCYESARSDMGSMIDDQSLFPISGSSASLGPIKRIWSQSECFLNKCSSSESANNDPIIVITSGNRS